MTAVYDELKKLTEFTFFGICIQLGDGHRFWTSNHAETMQQYRNQGYDRVDTLFEPQWLQDVQTITYNQTARDALQQQAIDFRHQHNIYLRYGLARHCDDCHVLIFCGKETSIVQQRDADDTILSVLEQLAIQLINDVIDDIQTALPKLKKSRFISDDNYRQHIISNRSSHLAKLFPSEVEVLYWAARGKTAEETALILGLTINTLYSYRKNAIAKLNCSNIAHAVHKAHLLGLIN